MRALAIGLSFAAMMVLQGRAAADTAPRTLAGFVLGNDIARHADQVRLETALPIRYQPYLMEVETAPIAGFKSGLVAWGQCDRPGKILRIKMKYEDASKSHYEALLKRFRERFGEPQEWRGDPFHILSAWKWSFEDARSGRISLILQHNTQNEEEKMGTAVKMTLTGQMERERLCHEQKAAAGSSGAAIGPDGPATVSDWEMLLPR